LPGGIARRGEFAAGPTFDSFLGLKFFLEDNLARAVDIVTPEALKPRVVEREAVDVA
jgi:predicted nucleotidyltransferase